MEDISLRLELLTGKIKKVKRQLANIERNRRRKDISLSPLKKNQQRSKRPISIATSTPKAVAAKNSKFNRWQGSLRNSRLAKATGADTSVESIDTDNSDCEVVEQPSDLIVLDDDSNPLSSSSTWSRRQSNCSGENTTESAGPTQTSEIETRQFSDTKSGDLFYEDREPSINYTVPIYESLQCAVVDSSVESSINSSNPIDTMPKSITVRNEHYSRNEVYNRNDKSGVSVKDRLGNRCQRIVDEFEPSTSKQISSDTPSVPKMRVQISIQPTENEVTTRTCTITSSSAESSESTGQATTDCRDVLRTKNVNIDSDARAPSNSIKIVITNGNAPSATTTTGAGVAEKSNGSQSIVDQNNLKRQRQDSDVVLIDDTLPDSRRDDSVIFVSESIHTGRPVVPRKRKGGPVIKFGSEYIPIAGKRDTPPAKMIKTKSTRAQRKMDKKAERRKAQLEMSRKQQPSTSKVINTVAKPNNNKGDKNSIEDPNQLEKRMIIIDGSNVAFKHGGQKFSVRGIELCLNYFQLRGFEVKAVVPQMRIKANKSTDPKRLNELVNADKVILTPCKNLPDNRSISYDDRIILDIAAGFDAAIISNDNYSELVNEKPEWDVIIKNHVVGFTWCKDLIVFPDDPYGRQGPRLNQILYKPKSANDSELKSGNIEKKSE